MPCLAGFQTWGETSDHPVDYAWGKTARAMAFATLRWVARGGSHLNFYMWLGGYNRGRAAAAAITNAYAMDAPMCPSGQRRYPKFLHFQALLWALQSVAPILLESPSALHQEVLMPVWTDRETWEVNPNVKMFSYSSSSPISFLQPKDLVDFVENASNASHLVRVPEVITNQVHELEMPPYSAILRLNGHVIFDSSEIPSKSKSFVRRMDYGCAEIAHWTYWLEPIGVSPLLSSHLVQTDALPKEQTLLNVESKVWSDYAWYETDFVVPRSDVSADGLALTFVAPDANAYVVYLDGHCAGAVESHARSERNVSFRVNLPAVDYDINQHTLSILSESLGYSNLIGRWGYHNTKAKPKGLVGEVAISTRHGTISLTDGTHTWRMFPGLHGSQHRRSATQEEDRHRWIDYLTRAILDENLSRTDLPPEQLGILQGSYSSFLFRIPDYDPEVKGLFLDIRNGRGHVWLNGHDLGRYWNITRGDDGGSNDGSKFSQRYYFLPHDFLIWNRSSATWNEIVFFDALGGSHNRSRLLLSWLESCEDGTCVMEDEIDFPNACI
jgi:Glycosyl hydrolases family 35